MTIDNTQPTIHLGEMLITTGSVPTADPDDPNAGGYTLGMLREFAYDYYNFAGMMYARGQFLPINQNGDLYSLLGTEFGGNGQTTFALPDLRYVAVIGATGPTGADFAGLLGTAGSPVIQANLPVIAGGGDPVANGNLQPSIALTYLIGTTGFVGGIVKYAGGTELVPAGYLVADGSLVSKAQYGALWDAIGTTYNRPGDDDDTMFRLPDLVGRNVVGTSATLALGETFGSATMEITQDQLPVEMGGTGEPIDNHAPGIALRFIISLYGTAPGGSAVPTDNQPFVGEIRTWAGNGPVPMGWAACDGSPLPIEDHETLFTYIGVTYGGDGQSTFALPDLSGLTVAGVTDYNGAHPLATTHGTASFTLSMADIPALDIDGTPDNDVYYGGDLADTILGNGGDDSITGNGGNDSLEGGDGNDTISGGLGANIIKGDAGDDSLAGGAEGDNINGGADNDTILSGGGADTLSGGDGADVFMVTSPTDLGTVSISGGNGDALADTVELETAGSYNFTTANVTGIERISLASDDASWTLALSHALLSAAAGKTISIGSSVALTHGVKITMTGYDPTGTAAILVDGRNWAGNDTITGTWGNDTIYAGTGNDNIDARDGDDLFIFTANNQVGAGTYYSGFSGFNTLLFDFTQLAAGVVFDVWQAGFAGFDAVTLRTAHSGDTIRFDAEQFGGADIDNDVTFSLDATSTSQSYSIVVLAATNLSAALWTFSNALGANADNLSLLKLKISGTGSNDQITGSILNDSIDGGGGGWDDLSGGAGSDTITGGVDDDTITGGAGADSLTGGRGDDVFILTGDELHDHSTLATDTINGGSGTDTIRLEGAGPFDRFDHISGIEAFVVADPAATRLDFDYPMANDTGIIDISATVTVTDAFVGITSDFMTIAVRFDSTNFVGGIQFTSGGGDDTLMGTGARDALISGAGDDVFVVAGVQSLDYFNGRNGHDELRLTGAGTYDFFTATTTQIESIAIEVAAGQVTLGFVNGQFQNVADGVISVHSDVTRTGAVKITVGNPIGDQLVGSLHVDGHNFDGNDTILAGYGYDTVNAGYGSNTISGGGGFDTLDYSFVTSVGIGIDIAAGTVTAAALAGVNTGIHDTIDQIEAFIGGGGNDTFTSGAGNDSMDGAGGSDTAIFSGDWSDYLISYSSGTGLYTVTDQRGGGTGTDTLKHIESFVFNGLSLSAADAADDAPDAVDDINSGELYEASGNVIGDATTSGDVLANDSDADIALLDGNSDPLDAISVNGIVKGTGSDFTDVDSSSPTVIAGKYGTLTIHSDGTYSYVLDNTDPDTDALKGSDTGLDVFTYRLADSKGLTSTAKLTLSIHGSDDVPLITSAATAGINEGAALNFTVTSVLPDNTTVYSLFGDDAALFTIDASSGLLQFRHAPDYEHPGDLDHDNVYSIVIRATSSADNLQYSNQGMLITVSNVNETPVITSNGGGATAAISIAENRTAVTTVISTDPEATPRVYSISGDDASKFTINAATGALAFRTAPNREAPTDLNHDNVYKVVVRASDGTLSDTQALSITVTNVNEAPLITSNGGGTSVAINVNENALAVTTAIAADDGPTKIWSLTGADAALFKISSTGVVTFKAAPDFEAPSDVGKNNVYNVTVKVSDGSLFDTQNLAITVKNIAGNTIAGTVGNDTIDLTHKIGVKGATGEEDKIDGKAGNDTINGGLGNDTLIGGAGKDVLTGAAGADRFVFNAALNAATNVDTIKDFTHDLDLIQLDDAIFKTIGNTLDAAEFYAKAGATAAHDASDRIIYDKTSGKLFFDDDGTGSHAAIWFATLSTKPQTLDHGDFGIV